MSERLQRIQEVFAQAAELSSTARGAFLDQHCAGEPDLRREVEELLALERGEATDESKELMRRLEAGVSVAAAPPAATLAPGTRVGDFEIRRVLGSGGMGTVYEARQLDLERTVALKMLRCGPVSAAQKRRFQHEGEILARLHHPGIAEVYRSGTIGDVPYFAMRYVEGARPLDEYVEASRPDLRALVELFVQVLEAVHHGHQNGVIHRDIKPKNVLVDPTGQPLVIDFGIALVRDEPGVERTAMTRAGELLGTLQYMSPEQLQPAPDGSGVDVRSDVYALGVVLYELLAGKPPFDIAGQPITAAVTTLLRQEPARPSRLSERFAPSAELAELDGVVLKAMDRAPDRRYASVSEFAADLRRFLRDEPVIASPPSAGYRLRKFARRHRLALGAAAVCLVFLVGGIVATSLGWARAVRAEQAASASAQLAEQRLQQAQRESDTLQRVNDFMREMIGEAHPGRGGRDVKVVTMLDRAARQIDTVYAGWPHLAVAFHNLLASTYNGLGIGDRALAHAQAAMTLAETALAADHPSHLLACTNLGGLLARRGEAERARPLLQRALAGQLATLGEQDVQTQITLVELGCLCHDAGEFAAAVGYLRRAVAAAEQNDRTPPRRRIRALSSLVTALQSLGERDEAAALGERTVTEATELLGEDDPATLAALENQAAARLRGGDAATAAAAFERIAAIRERVLGPSHPDTTQALCNLAAALTHLERYADAEVQLRRAVELQRSRGAAARPQSLSTAHNLATVLLRAGKSDAAEQVWREALPLAEGRLPDGHWLLATLRKGLGEALVARGAYAEAEPLLLGSLAVFEHADGDMAPRIEKTLEALVELYERWGKPDAAAGYRQRLSRR